MKCKDKRILRSHRVSKAIHLHGFCVAISVFRVVQALSVTTYEFFTIIKAKLLRTILGHKYTMGNSTLNICRLRENPECCMIKYYKRA